MLNKAEYNLYISESAGFKVLLIAMRWFAFLLALFLSNFHKIEPIHALPPMVESIGVLVVLGAVALYNIVATYYVYVAPTYRLSPIPIVFLDVIIGIIFIYFYGLSYFCLAFLLPVMTVLIFFGSSSLVYAVALIGLFVFSIIVHQWILLFKNPGQDLYVAQLEILMILSILILWVTSLARGNMEQLINIHYRYEGEKSLLDEEMQTTKDELKDLCNELENRRLAIEKLQQTIKTTREETEKTQRLLNDERKKMSLVQKDARLKDDDAHQFIKEKTDEFETKLGQISALLTTIKNINSSLDLVSCLKSIVAELEKQMPSQSYIIFLAEDKEDGPYLFPYLAKTPYSEYFRNFQIKFGEGLVGWVANKKQPVKIENHSVTVDGETLATLINYEKSTLVIPLMKRDQSTMGVLYLGRAQAKAFSDDEVKILMSINDLIAESLENSINYKHATEASMRDKLTGLYTKDYFKERFKEELNKTKRTGDPFAIMRIKIDQYDEIKKSMGEQAFNGVMKKLSEILKNHTREMDILARETDDESIVFLAETEKQNAVLIAERIRMMINLRLLAEGQNKKLKITASIGLSAFPKDSDTPDLLLQIANKAVLEASKKGGNITCFLPEKG